jgi:DNA-directed RNA polymerase specialized sigma24 family protein
VVIFCYDVEKRLGRLEPMEQQLIKRVALQRYTCGEAAGMLGLTPRSCHRYYGEAVDRLTGMFLEAEMLEPLKCCQEGRAAVYRPTN